MPPGSSVFGPCSGPLTAEESLTVVPPVRHGRLAFVHNCCQRTGLVLRGALGSRCRWVARPAVEHRTGGGDRENMVVVGGRIFEQVYQIIGIIWHSGPVTSPPEALSAELDVVDEFVLDE